jgi:hypothetical protein
MALGLALSRAASDNAAIAMRTGMRNRYRKVVIRAKCVIVLLLIANSGACVQRVPDRVTCQNLRALKIGMTPKEVQNIVGPPRLITNRAPKEVLPHDEIWDYETDGLLGGLSFNVGFDSGTLSRVVLYSYFQWDQRSRDLYYLTKDFCRESPRIGEYISCTAH